MSVSKPSKSARKREYLYLQSLGEQLIDLSSEQLASISLDDQLLEAVQTAKSMKVHGALRRQKQLIGKLMREVDPQPIRVALEAFGRHDNLAKEVFREAEQWRDRIAAEGSSALADFFALIGGENRELKELSKTYATAAHDKARRLTRRRIFSEIHKELASMRQNTSR
jgi:ribosome-associated protein